MTRHNSYVPMERVDKELWHKEKIIEREKRRKYDKKKKPVSDSESDV